MAATSASGNERQETMFERSGWNLQSDVVKLDMGAPGPDSLTRCVSIFEEATPLRLSKEHTHGNLFQYGPECGNWEYREQLARFLGEEYKTDVKRENLVLTGGATFGTWLAASVLIPPRSPVFIEDPTYYIMLNVLCDDLQMPVVPVPVLKDGIDTDMLEKLVAEEKGQNSWSPTEDKPFRGMIYTIPTFHNPTGISYSADRCRKLVQIARENDLLVLCDDVYNLLHYGTGGQPPTRLLQFDSPDDLDYKGHVVSVGTFSKIMAPGIRVGWLEAAPRMINLFQKCGILGSGGSVNNYTAGIMTVVMEGGYQTKHLNFLRQIYTERMDAMCSTLQTHLPPGSSFSKPQGGYFVWVSLPPAFNTAAFTPWCISKYKISVIEGFRFSVTKKFQNCIRLSISCYQKDQIVAAVKTLCEAIKEFLEGESCDSVS